MPTAAAPFANQPLDAGAAFAVGVDIGGTFIKVGVLDREAKVLERVEYESQAERGFVHFVERIGEAVELAVRQANLTMSQMAGVGLGYPGTVYPDTGCISGSPNIPGAHGSNLLEPLIKRFDRAVVVHNDASAAALGECLYGAGKSFGAKNVVLFTLGTGVGGGVVIDGKLVTGAHHQATELGHMIVDPDGPACGCGCFGCLEAFCGTAGILRSAWKRLQTGRASRLWDYIHEFGRPELTPKMISLAAADGDEVALEVWAEMGYYLGLGCVSAIQFADPAVIILAGQVAKAGPPLFDAVKRTVRARQRLNPWPWQNIVEAGLGEDAGLIGAAAGVLTQL